MKQLDIKEFFKRSAVNSAEEKIDIFTNSDSDNGKNKENRHKVQNGINNKALKIGELSTRLSLAKTLSRKIVSSSRKTSINSSDFNGDEEQQDFNYEEIASEERERKLMQAHGFYSNDAICLPSWKSDKLIPQLEGSSYAITIHGEEHIKRTFGGSKYSDEAISILRKKGKRRRSSSSDEEISDQDESNYKKPQTQDNQWIVEKLLSKRIVSENNVRSIHYFLKWKGWAYKYSSWEKHCKENTMDDLINKFNQRQRWREVISRRVPANERIFYHNNYMNDSLLRCHQWEDEMNDILRTHKHKQAPIYVENWVDGEAKPRGFSFILENKFSKETTKTFRGIEKVQHCNCVSEGKECGSLHNCCPEIFGQNYCYLPDDTVNPRMVYKDCIVECTDACQCDITCPTRVAQRGRQIPIVLFRTQDRGWSVRTCVSVKKHSFVCEYLGEVLTNEEALNSRKASTYQFQMDSVKNKKYIWIVDAAKLGNEARFINHSCNPNLVVRTIFADRLDIDYLRITFFAKREIRRGEELTIDYQAIDKFAKGRRQTECRCKSKRCKGVFYY